MWPVCKKELRQFFSSLTGFIAIVFFLLLTGMLLFVLPGNIFEFGYATLDAFFDAAPWILLVLVPALTMRSFAEEFRTGTYELLHTLPLTRPQLVGGKFLAAWLVTLAAVLPTLIYPYSLSQLAAGEGIDLGGTLGSYVGLAMLSAVFVAIGVFCSSLTANPVVAFIAAIFGCVCMYGAFMAVSRLPLFEGGADYYLEMIGLDYHYRSLSRGVLDSRDMLYFLSVTVFFLILTGMRLRRSPWKRPLLPVAGLIAAVVLLNALASLVHVRADLTAEKRYTLSAPTKRLLAGLEEPVYVDVFLAGELPADFRKLQNSAEELLQEFREVAGSRLIYRFQRPGADLDAEQRQALLRYLDSMGIHPTNVQVQLKEGESREERLVYPGALVSAGGRSVAVDLLKGQDMGGGIQTLNTAEALLEYHFASAIQQAARPSQVRIGYLLGNGQPLSYNVYDLIERTLKPAYAFSFLPIDSVPVIPRSLDLLLIVKPTLPFTDQQKLKLDQYVMHGGKLIWMVDVLYAEMDSLMRRQSDFIAFDRGLNMDDLLFRYGVRINRDLLQDLQCDRIPLAVGSFGDQPQLQLLPWPYFPLLSSYSGHPIAKNLHRILSIFPNSMDTVEAEGIRKTILLASSSTSRKLGTPAIVSLNSVQTEEDIRSFRENQVPVAVLLEGRFSSLFARRISAAQADSLAQYDQPFLAEAAEENAMIVISDADIASNVVTQQEGPLTMGMNQFTQMQYANRDFILNCIEYLTNPSGILTTRGKSVTLRLLDPARLERQGPLWKLLNNAAPVALMLLAGAVFQVLRTKKYTA